MKIRSVLLRVGLTAFLGVVLGVGPIVSAVTTTTTYEFAASPDIFMTELQTASATSASDEFIEIYNNSDNDIDFSDTSNGGKTQWKLQYFSKTNLNSMLAANADASGWSILPGAKANTATKTIVLTGSVPAHAYFVVAATGYNPGNIETDLSFAPGMAADGGGLQLVSVTTLTATTTQTTVHDRLAWAAEGILNPANPDAYSPALTGKTLQRTLNTEDRYNDAENQLESWDSAAMTPKGVWTPPDETTTDNTDNPSDNTGDSTDTDTPNPSGDATDENDDTATPEVITNEGLEMPKITELLPNPSSDESDEYIELYNPNDEAFNLKGYELQTGIDSIHSFVVTSDTLLPAETYTVLKYTDTKLALTNSGGRARLLNPIKQIVSETTQYTTAHEAWAWAINASGQWAWTDTPTPGKENVFPITSLNESPLQKATKTAKVKGVSTKKAAKKTTKVKTTKKKTAKKATAKTASLPSAAEQNVQIHPIALAAVGIAALGYVAYEYRKDIANKLARLRRH